MLSLKPMPRQVQAEAFDVLARVLEEDVNLAIWQRRLREDIQVFVHTLLAKNTPLAEALSVDISAEKDTTPLDIAAEYAALPGYAAFISDVGLLVDAFAYLVGAERVGVRLRVLESAMCPRFHVDRVPLRLVTTYQGPGCEWLKEGVLHRTLLNSLAAEQVADAAIQHMHAGDVALLKGERWEGNELTPIVHRSPTLTTGQRRLILTLDWLS